MKFFLKILINVVSGIFLLVSPVDARQVGLGGHVAWLFLGSETLKTPFLGKINIDTPISTNMDIDINIQGLYKKTKADIDIYPSTFISATYFPMVAELNYNKGIGHSKTYLIGYLGAGVGRASLVSEQRDLGRKSVTGWLPCGLGALGIRKYLGARFRIEACYEYRSVKKFEASGVLQEDFSGSVGWCGLAVVFGK
jgi:hypothetical protein